MYLEAERSRRSRVFVAGLMASVEIFRVLSLSSHKRQVIWNGGCVGVGVDSVESVSEIIGRRCVTKPIKMIVVVINITRAGFLFDLSPIEKSANRNPNFTLPIVAQVIGNFNAGTTSDTIAAASRATTTMDKA
jgi:hypothetical protein